MADGRPHLSLPGSGGHAGPGPGPLSLSPQQSRRHCQRTRGHAGRPAPGHGRCVHHLAGMRQEGPVTLAHVLYPHSRRPVEELTALVTTLQEALPTGKPVQLRYQPEKAPATVRVVQPLEVYYERGHGYMRAFCHLRREERHFRLDRIVELIMLHE